MQSLQSLQSVVAQGTRQLTKRLDRGSDALTFDLEGAVTDPYRITRTSTLLGATAAIVPAVDAVRRNFRAAQRLRLRETAGALHHL